MYRLNNFNKNSLFGTDLSDHRLFSNWQYADLVYNYQSLNSFQVLRMLFIFSVMFSNEKLIVDELKIKTPLYIIYIL